ncbi:MAG TPA: RtcB family protein [Candidatus Acidoferrales bacterium]|nr:RtcB family protein [Candidatus Acidoferrales bacterium]
MDLKKVNDFIWEIEKDPLVGMRVPGRIFLSKTLLNFLELGAIQQVTNVAKLPGIQKYSLAMPDVHTGYGFPIGGVAAFDIMEGIISPGGVGFDINCGTRLLATGLKLAEVYPRMQEVINELYTSIPAGLGSKGKLKVSEKELDEVFINGAKWALRNGYGNESDLKHCESNGHMEGGDPSKISKLAKKRGMPQLGSLGSGNHFVEVQYVAEIYNKDVAHTFGLWENQVCIMVHSGSRGAGHQICTDYLRAFQSAASKYDIQLPDKQLACVPADSTEANDYFSAMSSAANYAWTNRQMMSFWVREVFEREFNATANVVYDVAHNIAKLEKHKVDGETKEVYVHRKGATRSFDKDPSYGIGQPVLIPGSMGTSSYVLCGTKEAMEMAFGSTCHGAGRVLSRKAAKHKLGSKEVIEDLRQKHVFIKTGNVSDIPEEAPEAYKPIDEVIRVVNKLNLSEVVLKLKPIGVIKG